MRFGLAGAALVLAIASSYAQHGGHPPSGHAGAGSADTREFVAIPEPMNTHMLANMRDHLAAIEEIQSALAKGDLALAGKTAESRIGMSSLESHGASHIAGFMPKGMQDAGMSMHRAASRFALVASDAGVTGDLRAPLEALAEVTRACIGCHAGYRTR